jgi:hypothetical protein
MKIRSISIEYSIKKSKQEKETTRILENDIQNLENEMNLRPRDCTQILLNQKKTELEIKRQHIIDGSLLRSLANWHENGGKCTEYFCKLQKKSFINKTISELIDHKGNNISDQSKILSEQECFYKNLYSRKSLFDNDDSFFHHDVGLTDEQRDSCEGNLTFKECGEAHKLMKNGKSLGSDGFTVDFFKFFGKILVLLYFVH